MSLWLTTALLLAGARLAISDVIQDGVCSARGRSATVNPNADVFIRTLLSFSNAGGENYGCGGPRIGRKLQITCIMILLVIPCLIT